jgi:hypothetical protein
MKIEIYTKADKSGELNTTIRIIPENDYQLNILNELLHEGAFYEVLKTSRNFGHGIVNTVEEEVLMVDLKQEKYSIVQHLKKTKRGRELYKQYLIQQTDPDKINGGGR